MFLSDTILSWSLETNSLALKHSQNKKSLSESDFGGVSAISNYLTISGIYLILAISNLSIVSSFIFIDYNGYVYETFGISKHFPVKLQVLLIRAETLDNPLTAKCFIGIIV
jgi:hypothetical protein